MLYPNCAGPDTSGSCVFLFMASEKQIAANKENAKASTGPITAGGLKRSSKNAIKHSLTASDITISDENAGDFEALRDSYIEAFQPDDAIEMRLVEQMVVAAWRLNRAHRIEAQVFRSEIKRQEYEAQNPSKVMKTSTSFDDWMQGKTPEHLKANLGSAFRQLSDSRDRVFPLLRYETTAERSLYRALHTLERLLERRQERRRARPVSVPRVIDGGFPKEEP